MEKYAILAVGILLIVLGIVNMTGNISTIHSYNRKNVSEEDIPKYGKLVGIGTALVGVGVIAWFTLDLFQITTASSIVMIAFTVVGIAIILYAQFKYNKGIF